MFSQSTFAELCRSNEDNVSGKVSYSWFIQFSDKYENEQKKIKERGFSLNPSYLDCDVNLSSISCKAVLSHKLCSSHTTPRNATDA